MENNNNNEIRNVEFSAFSNSRLPLYYIDSDLVFITDIEKLPELSTMKLKFNVFGGCIEGKMELDVNDKHYVVLPGQVFICPSNQIISNLMISPDLKFQSMCLTDRIIQQLLSTNVDIWNRAVYVRAEKVWSPVPGHNPDTAQQMMSLLHDIIEEKGNPFREEMVRSLLQIILLGFCAVQKVIEEKEGEQPLTLYRSPQGKVIFSKFCELIRDEEIKHQPVYYYAEKLCISAKYLSFVCKEITGKSANEFIQQAVVDEITHYLRNTSLSVKEIAGRLGFSNISFFGKYVKSRLGVSPNEFRKQLAEK